VRNANEVNPWVSRTAWKAAVRSTPGSMTLASANAGSARIRSPRSRASRRHALYTRTPVWKRVSTRRR